MSNPTPPTAQPDGTTAAPRPKRRRELVGELQVHEPHKVGLPPLGAYLATVWRRRDFAFELSRTNLRAQHFRTSFGQLWLIINPLLLACVYFILVDILRGGSRGAEFLAHLVAGIFVFEILRASLTNGVKSVVSGGKLILNSAFPRVLLPLAAVVTAFKRFLPTVPIYLIVHLACGLPLTATMLFFVPILALFLIMSAGLSMLVAAAQVYFRDLSSFLPYALRLWLYISPILYYADEVPERYRAILSVNPAAPLLTGWNDAIIDGQVPDGGTMLLGLAWATVLFLAGALFFMSREREFAVRL